MQTETARTDRPHLSFNKTFFGLKLEHWLLILILGLSLVLHLVNLDSISTGNAYYAAAVRSMSQSWYNFFFAAAEPGASVTVDKPPLGLWTQTLSTLIFGYNGFALMLPQILAGVLSVWVVYRILGPRFGPLAGLAAGLLLALSPVALAVERNNTMDAQLNLVLLLAAWAVLIATERDKPGWLYLGAVLVGLGFNIKMLQAFLPLPALIALYFFISRRAWWRKLLHLALATLILLVVSFAWVAAVDLTPTEARPYIGSSEDNTVLSLIIGHNGLNRLFGRHWLDGLDNANASAADSPDEGHSPQAPNPNQPPDRGGDGDDSSPSPDGRGPDEIGTAGITRLFIPPLSNEALWFLPLALLSPFLIFWLGKKKSNRQLWAAVLLWGGWLLTCVIFFSFASFFHAYYLSLLSAPIALLCGISLSLLTKRQTPSLLQKMAFTLLLILTLAVQAAAGWAYAGAELVGLVGTAFLLGLLGLTLWWANRLHWAAVILLVVSLCLMPGWWSLQTVLNDRIHSSLPSAWEGAESSDAPHRPGEADARRTDPLLAYLLDHNEDEYYLGAVPSAMQGADWVIETGLPVLYMGGFSGGDPVASADDLAALVETGELRYVLWNTSPRTDRQTRAWLRETCSSVHLPFLKKDSRRGGDTSQLFDCGK
jgi:4-amino-4-deoxy-L-arabinose transferase-like glycosyltransferase